MSYNQQFQKDLFKLLVTNPEFIHNMLKYELPIPIEAKDKHNNTLLNRLLIENTENIKLINDKIMETKRQELSKQQICNKCSFISYNEVAYNAHDYFCKNI